MPRGGTASPSPIKSTLYRLATRGSSLPSHRHRGQSSPGPWELPLSIEQQPTLPRRRRKGRRRPRAWAGVGQVAPRGLVAGGAEQVQADVAVAGRNQRLPVVPELDQHTANGWIIYLHRESLTQQATPGAFNRGRTRTGLRGLRTTQPMGPMIELKRAIKTPTRPPTTEKRQWRRRRYWARSTSGSCPLVSVSQIDRCPAKGRTGGLPMIQSRSPLRPTAQVHTSGRDSHPLGLWRDLLRT
jgi:hypothetical protein